MRRWGGKELFKRLVHTWYQKLTTHNLQCRILFRLHIWRKADGRVSMLRVQLLISELLWRYCFGFGREESITMSLHLPLHQVYCPTQSVILQWLSLTNYNKITRLSPTLIELLRLWSNRFSLLLLSDFWTLNHEPFSRNPSSSDHWITFGAPIFGVQ